MSLFRCLLLLLLSGLISLPAAADSLTMIDHEGKSFDLKSQRGQVVLVFFGYTRCPDICPIGLSIVSRVVNDFARQELPVAGLFVSVDRERDSPEVLRKYLSYFSPRLIGLTGSKQQLSDFAQYFGVNYQIKKQADASMQVDHSANLYVLDREGNIHTMIPFGLGEEHVKRVVGHILDKNRNQDSG